jgi:hypothetical protein
MYSIPLIQPRIITCFHLKYLKTVITTLLLPKHAHIHDRPKMTHICRIIQMRPITQRDVSFSTIGPARIVVSSDNFFYF